MKPILVAGIGNILMGDDGIGAAVVAALLSHGRVPADVDVEDLGTPGLELAGYLTLRQTVILIDALASVAPAGTIHLFRKNDILARKTPIRTDAHSASLADSLCSLTFAGQAPSSVTLVGIAGQDWSFGRGISPPVAQAVKPALRIIRALLSSHATT